MKNSIVLYTVAAIWDYYTMDQNGIYDTKFHHERLLANYQGLKLDNANHINCHIDRGNVFLDKEAALLDAKNENGSLKSCYEASQVFKAVLFELELNQDDIQHLFNWQSECPTLKVLSHEVIFKHTLSDYEMGYER